MNKEQKVAAVEKLTEQLKSSEAIFAIDYRGISVPQAAELRAGLRDAGTDFRVVKNRLTLRAADAAGTTEIKDHLVGPTALALVDGDVALAAKTLTRLGSEWELLEYKGGIMDGAALDPDAFKTIARLPGRDQLNAQLAGVVASPITGLVRGLGSMVQGLALQLQAIADQGLVTGEAPPAPAEEEAPAGEEAPAEETSSEAPKEVEPPAAADVEKSSSDEAGGAEDGSPDDASSDEAPEPTSEQGDPDPDPASSPEEEPSEEQAPEGEDAGEGVPQTGEGDADPGDDEQEETSDSDDSEDVQDKEDAS